MGTSAPTASELRFAVDRGEFFSVGRALQRGFGKRLLGAVTIEVRNAKVTIDSKRGGANRPCMGNGEVCVEVTAKAFCGLITPRFRQKNPSGTMVLSFRPLMKEIATDDVGVRAKFLSLRE